jgi:predicted ATPase/DNA-binding winged helix-turn-helix (wHTH) protein
MNPATDASTSVDFGRFRILLHRRELLADNRPVELGGRAFDLLLALIEAGGAVVSKDALLERVWPDRIVEENNLQFQISTLRKALAPDRDLIRTITGRGYQFTGEIRTVPALPDARMPEGTAEATATPSRRSTNLPVSVSELIGRDAELSEIQDLCVSQRLVTLTGAGGIGKTRLGFEVARHQLPRFTDGVWAAELAPLSDPDLVPVTVATALGLELTSGSASPQSVANALRSKQLMLVLDNCEHVIDAAARMAEALLRANPAARVIATSREPLRAGGEWVYPVLPLAVPLEGSSDGEDPLRYGAVRLFGERARAAAPNFSPDSRTAAAIAGICRRLDGIPLAIELAAARTAALGIEELATRLDDRFRLLTRGRRTALPRHQTLRGALDWSYELLTEPERVGLRRLAVFAGGFTLRAAREVVADDNIMAAEIDDCVGNLVAKSLIIADIGDTMPRYRLLDTTRAYALEKLAESVDAERLRRRHAEYYRDLLEPAEETDTSQGRPEWLAIYARHIDNLRTGLDWAFSENGDLRIAVALTVAAVPLWIHLSLLGECRERVERALAALDVGAPETARQRMRLSGALGWSLMYGVGRSQEAGPAWTTTLELAEALHDTHYQLRALWGLCIDQFNNGVVGTALEFARRFAGLVAHSTDPIELMMADRILATALHYLGDQRNARHHIDRALAYDTTSSWRPKVVSPGFDLRVSAQYFQARILWLQGFADQAMQVVERNVEEGLALGQALTFCSVLGQAACPISFLAGDLEAAEKYGMMLLTHTGRHQIRLWNIWAGCFNGLVTARRGDILGGLRILRDGLEQAGDARLLPRFLVLQGEQALFLGRTGEVDLALERVEQMLARCTARAERWYVAELLRIKGELMLARGGPAEAADIEKLFFQSLNEARLQGALSWELRTATSLARLWQEDGRRADAGALLRPVHARLTEGLTTADRLAAEALLNGLP